MKIPQKKCEQCGKDILDGFLKVCDECLDSTSFESTAPLKLHDYSPLKPHDYSPIPSPTQPDWRYCSKCKMKFITADKSGTCPQCGGEDVPYTNQEIIQGIDKDITANKPDTESWEKDFDEFWAKLAGNTRLSLVQSSKVKDFIHQVEEKARRETRNEWFDMAEKAREEGRKEWLPTRQQEIDEAYQRGLHKGYEEEAVGCHEHCKEARQSTLREILEMIEEEKVIEGIKSSWHKENAKGYNQALSDLLSKIKEKLSTNQK